MCPSAGAEAGNRVRDILASKLVNELVEAADDKQRSKTISRYGRVDLQALLVRDGLAAVAEWEAEHGRLSEVEMDAAGSTTALEPRCVPGPQSVRATDGPRPGALANGYARVRRSAMTVSLLADRTG